MWNFVGLCFVGIQIISLLYLTKMSKVEDEKVRIFYSNAAIIETVKKCELLNQGFTEKMDMTIRAIEDARREANWDGYHRLEKVSMEQQLDLIVEDLKKKQKIYTDVIKAGDALIRISFDDPTSRKNTNKGYEYKVAYEAMEEYEKSAEKNKNTLPDISQLLLGTGADADNYAG